MIAAVVPVKGLARAKARLRPGLPDDAAHGLVLAMLGDVVEALLAVPALARVVVATPDPEVAAAAAELGAEALLRDDPGLNAAIEAACADVAPGVDDAALVVLGDVACARSDELQRLVDCLTGPGVALAPSSDGGTSALLRRPCDRIPAGFGPGSAGVHRERARRAGAAFRELALPSLALDVDGPEDLARLSGAGGGGPRTHAWLRRIERATRAADPR